MTNQGSETEQASSLSAEIDEAIAWCSYSSGHKTARLLVRLRGEIAEAERRGWHLGYTDACNRSTDPYITADIEAQRADAYEEAHGE